MIYFKCFRISLSFTCRMYSSRPGANSINELRYRLFCSKRGIIESDQRPPCADCLSKHACRANYQTGIWRRSLENCPEIPIPLRHGWIQDENKLGIDQMSGQPASATVLQLISCSCTRSCRLPNCSCLANGLKRTAGPPSVITGEKNKLSRQTSMLMMTRVTRTRHWTKKRIY